MEIIYARKDTFSTNLNNFIDSLGHKTQELRIFNFSLAFCIKFIYHISKFFLSEFHPVYH